MAPDTTFSLPNGLGDIVGQSRSVGDPTIPLHRRAVRGNFGRLGPHDVAAKRLPNAVLVASTAGMTPARGPRCPVALWSSREPVLGEPGVALASGC